MKIINGAFVVVFLLFLNGCNSKEENKSSLISKQEVLKTDSIKNVLISKKYFNLDSVFMIISIDTLKIDSLSKYSFQLDKEFYFQPISQRKVITNYIDPRYGYSDDKIILNPFTKETSDTIKLENYAKKLIEYTGKGSSPDETMFMASNDGRIKVLSNSYSVYSVSDLYPLNNKKALVIRGEEEKKDIVISDINKVFSCYGRFFINDTLYYLKEGINIQVFNKTGFSYSYNVQDYSFKFKNGKTLDLKNEVLFNALLFPINNNIFFNDTNSKFTTLLSYDVITGLSKKYVLPVWTNHFYFAKDGFYIEYSYDIERREGKESNSSKFSTYGFIKY
jgi:hypothetical protein